jgi:hypothetical protein
MISSLLLAASITAPGAPIPKDSQPNPSGPAPRILAVKASEDGGITIIATVYEKRKIQQQFFVVENGKQVLKQQETEIMTQTYIQKGFSDFGSKFTMADGSSLTSEQAIKKVKDGATILITADGKPIDPGWLKVVGTDTVVMVTGELAQAHFQYGHSALPSTPNPRLVLLGTDEKGNVRIPVNPNGANNQFDEYGNFQNGRVFRGGPGGRVVMANGMPVVADGSDTTTKPAGQDGKKTLEDICFDAYDLKGKLIPKADALKRLRAGGLVLFAGDNRFPDSEYLKAFREDMMVLVSAEFIFPPGSPNPYDAPAKLAAPAAVKPAPPLPGVPGAIAVPAAAVPAVQVQVQLVPAVPNPKVAPPVEKDKDAKAKDDKAKDEKPKEKEKADKK